MYLWWFHYPDFQLDNRNVPNLLNSLRIACTVKFDMVIFLLLLEISDA